MSVRHAVIGLNIVALVGLAGFVIWAVLSPKRASPETKPANLEPFLPDEDLESRRLERVQGWALLFAAIVAVALPLYWLHEPSRQEESVRYFEETSAERGEVLFSNTSMPKYEGAVSLQSANCHGANGQGGVAPFAVDGEPVQWKAPPLNTVLLRFQEDPGCANLDIQALAVCNVTDIITYGRPGTPMQPWGVEGGGPKNNQSIQDLIAYLRTIQLTPKEAQAQAVKALADARQQPQAAIKSAREARDATTKTLAEARTALQKALGQPGATDADLKAACETISKQLAKTPKGVDRKQAKACRVYTAAAAVQASDQAALDWTQTWARLRANVSDGQLLFEINCARCHTKGWSIFDPTLPPGKAGSVSTLGLPAGGGGTGGGIGFNLRDGDEIRRFGNDQEDGFAAQAEFVGAGSVPFKEYGDGGSGSGKMPGFSKMLPNTKPLNYLNQIVGYERYCVNGPYQWTDAVPACSTTPREPATTTTLAKKAKG